MQIMKNNDHQAKEAFLFNKPLLGHPNYLINWLKCLIEVLAF